MDIRVQELVKSFDNPDKPVLQGFSVDIEKGEFVSITGRSGSGKSTFLYCVSGLDTVSSGIVTVGGRNIHGMDQKEIHRFRNEEMGFVFQFHYLLPELSALENVLMPARKKGIHQEMEGEALALLEQFEVGHARSRKPSQMSGGEQQRVAIARAVAKHGRGDWHGPVALRDRAVRMPVVAGLDLGACHHVRGSAAHGGGTARLGVHG